MNQPNPYQSPEAGHEAAADNRYQPAYWSCDGRIGRLRYFSYNMIFNFYSLFSMAMINTLKRGTELEGVVVFDIVATIIAYMPTLIVWVVMARRRLFDLNHYSALAYLMLVPVINVLMWLYLITMPGKQEPNEQGLPPNANSALVYVSIVGMFVCMVAMLLFYIDFSTSTRITESGIVYSEFTQMTTSTYA